MVLDWKKVVVLVALLGATTALAVLKLLPDTVIAAVFGGFIGWFVPPPKMPPKDPA